MLLFCLAFFLFYPRSYPRINRRSRTDPEIYYQALIGMLIRGSFWDNRYVINTRKFDQKPNIFRGYLCVRVYPVALVYSPYASSLRAPYNLHQKWRFGISIYHGICQSISSFLTKGWDKKKESKLHSSEVLCVQRTWRFDTRQTVANSLI